MKCRIWNYSIDLIWVQVNIWKSKKYIPILQSIQKVLI